jgi:hypothetical protein
MKFFIKVPLLTSAEQFERLEALQAVFAQVCNALAPEVQRTRIWNRVVLHHMHYRSLRDKFPALGSQMVCNAIYAVSRTSRMIFQAPASPFFLQKLGNKPLPLLQFASNCPVYFDRHTLSIKGSKLSLFTLDGRMHFELTLTEAQFLVFKISKLREISLTRKSNLSYELTFVLESEKSLNEQEAQTVMDVSYLEADKPLPTALVPESIIPAYVSVEVAS